MPVYETGHARNVQRFQEMISFVTSWGSAYQPTNSSILLTALNTKLTSATAALDLLTASLTASKNAINVRESEYDGLRKLVTRVVNFYESTGTAANKIEDARTLKRKIDGKRAKPVKDDPETPENEAENSISASQQSYTQLAEHFNALIQLLAADPLYTPNESDLEISSLQSKLAAMQGTNADVIDAYTGLSTARVNRDTQMYAPDTGLVDLALLVKKYVKAAFGTASSQYDQIKGLEFKRPTN